MNKLKKVNIIHYYSYEGYSYNIDDKGRIKTTYSRWHSYAKWVRMAGWQRGWSHHLNEMYKQLISCGFYINPFTGEATRDNQRLSVPFDKQQLRIFHEVNRTTDGEYSHAERAFKNTVIKIIDDGKYPVSSEIIKRCAIKRRSKGLNGTEIRWRREICYKIGYRLKGRNLGDNDYAEYIPPEERNK